MPHHRAQSSSFVTGSPEGFNAGLHQDQVCVLETKLWQQCKAELPPGEPEKMSHKCVMIMS